MVHIADGEVDPTLWENFRVLELCINKCSASLGPLPYSPILLVSVDPPQEFFHLILVHTFLSVAMILLHHPLTRSNPPSQDKCQTWARKILYTAEQVPTAHFGSMHPIVAVSAKDALNVGLSHTRILDVLGSRCRCHSAGDYRRTENAGTIIQDLLFRRRIGLLAERNVGAQQDTPYSR